MKLVLRDILAYFIVLIELFYGCDFKRAEGRIILAVELKFELWERLY